MTFECLQQAMKEYELTNYLVNCLGKLGKIVIDENGSQKVLYHIYQHRYEEPLSQWSTNYYTGKGLRLFMSRKFPLKPGQLITNHELRQEIPKHIMEIEIDVEIKGAIARLNEDGYITLECCAGHKGDRGYICFLDELDREQLKIQLHMLGFKNYRTKSDVGGTVVTFQGMSDKPALKEKDILKV